jgi:hypothetical protein
VTWAFSKKFRTEWTGKGVVDGLYCTGSKKRRGR